MFRLRCIVLCLIFVFACASLSSADDMEKAYTKAKKSYQGLIESDQQRLFRHNWQRVITTFLTLGSSYPQHERAAVAAYMAAKACHGLYLASGLEIDARWAIDLYTEVARNYPQDTLADDSLYQAGNIERQAFNANDRADKLYGQILSTYPQGDMVDKARLEISDPGHVTEPDASVSISSEGTPSSATVGGEINVSQNGVAIPQNMNQQSMGTSIGSMSARTDNRSISGIKIPGAGLHCIVVDPGHGGKDPGAVGPGGVQEKDVALAMARLLAKRLREELGCKVLLSRDRDRYLSLEERALFANSVDADLFISIHANSAPTEEAYGIETYSLNYSKNDQAAAVVARENKTSLKEVGDLELILFDLMANSKIFESNRLAIEIQRNLVGKLNVHYDEVKNLGVRQGPFHVLLGATMPSVLIEAGFISNEREERRLNSTEYQEYVVDGIAAGVLRYAKERMLMAGK